MFAGSTMHPSTASQGLVLHKLETIVLLILALRKALQGSGKVTC